MKRRVVAKAGAMAIPYGVSLEGLINVIRAWNRAQGYARPLKAEQVAERIETGAKIASRAKVVCNQSSFLIQLGVLVKEGQSNRLTEAGQEVARAADSPLQEEFNSLMKKLILEWKQVQPLIEFVRNRGKVSRGEMFDRVLEEAKKSKSTTNAVMGGNTFVELLQRAGILVAEDDSVSLAGGLPRAAVKPLTPEVSRTVETPEALRPEEVPETPEAVETPEIPEVLETCEVATPEEVPETLKPVETVGGPTSEEAPEVSKPVEVPASSEAVEAPEVIKPVETPEAPAPEEAPEIIKPVEGPEEPTPEKTPEAAMPEEVPEVSTPEEALEIPTPEEEPEAPTPEEAPEALKPVEEPEPAKAVEEAEVSTKEEAPEVPKPAETPEEPTPEKDPEAPTRKEAPEISKPVEVAEEQKQERVEESSEEKEHRLPGARYLLGLVVIYAAIYAQYILPSMGLVFDMLLVYGVPIVVIGYLWGRQILHRSLNKMYAAVKYGFASYGGFTALGYLISLVLVILLILFDPSSLNLLQNPDPVLNTTPENAWLLVWLSFIVVGPAEEFLFRGFIYGGLLNMFGNRHWLSLAFLSSILFAAVHLYYALDYGIVSVIMFTQLISFGMAMAVSYYLSGGNLLVPAFIHGLFDATGFLTIAFSFELGASLRLDFVFVSLAVLLYVSLQRLGSRKVSY
ncbi:MAG: hypothetical protein C4K49_02065 [Candidatus Thorarchaeota archaeon]|nr:MAG: hypothetical protein C4K49_02065 [Candidatus Thorarchaeota archaeon]